MRRFILLSRIAAIFLFAASLSAQVQIGKGVQIGGTGGGGFPAGVAGQFVMYTTSGSAVAAVTASGDLTLSPAGAFTLNSVNSNTGTCGDSTHVGQVTLNVKGLATACTPVAISFPSTLTIQTSGTPNTSQSLLNFTVTPNTGVALTNPSGGVENAAGVVMGASGSSHAQGMVPDPGATAGTARYLREDGTFDVPPGNTIAALWGFGTSIMYGAGSTNASRLSAFALLASTTAAPAYNNGQTSATASLNVTQIFANYVPDPQNPSAMLFETGENDTNSCGTVPSGCTIDMLNQYSAADAWVAIPNQDRMMASASSATTGTWAYDSTFPTYQPTLTATYGTNEQSSSSGATKTFDIPTGVTAVGLIYGVANSATGTFTVTIDGTPVTDNCSSTTTFTSLPCGSVVYTSTTFSFYRQEFTVSSGSTHTLVVTKTNSAKSDIIGVDWNLPAANDGIVYQDAVLSNYAGYSAWNPQAVTVTNQLKADGWNVFYVDLVGGTPGVNTTTDIATSATQVCPASIDTGHPNDCGNLHMFQTIVNKEIASGVAIGNLNNVGQALVNNGLFQGVINISEGLGGVQNLRSGSNYYSVLNQSHVGGGVLWYNGAGNVFGAGMGQDASSGLPFSGSFANRVFASNIGVWNCDAVYNNAGLDTQAHFTDTRCTNVNTGQSYQLGPSMSAYFAPLQGTAIASAATIAPVDGVTHITGTTAITTITKPTLCITGVACQISLIADGAWSLGTGGNIALSRFPTVGSVVTLTYDATAALWYPTGGATVHSLGWGFGDVATSPPLTTSEVGYITVPFACTITGWHIMANTGTVTIKTARIATGGTALPTLGANSISTSGVSLSSGTLINSTTLTDFTSTTINAGDTLGFFITAVSGPAQVTFSLDCAQ